jgi:hypothetical protein
LEAKVVRLETKVSGLETKIQQQNSLITALQKEWHTDDMESKLHGNKRKFHAVPFNYTLSSTFCRNEGHRRGFIHQIKRYNAMNLNVLNLNVVILILIDTERTGAMAEIGKMPSSCSDLQRMGHKISGLYSVIGTRTVEMVYCNFYPNGKGKKQTT